MAVETDNALLETTGKRIRETRGEQGLSLEQLARLTGISAPALSLIETGKRDPRLTTLKRIAYALRQPLTAFIADASNLTELNASEPLEGYDLGEYQ